MGGRSRAKLQQCKIWSHWLREEASLLHAKSCTQRAPSFTRGRRAPSAAKELCCPASKETGPSVVVGEQDDSGSRDMRRCLPVLFCNYRCQWAGPEASVQRYMITVAACLGRGNHCVAEGQILLLQLQSSVSMSLLSRLLIASWVFLPTPSQCPQVFFSLQAPCPILFSLQVLLSLAIPSPPLAPSLFFFLEATKLLFQGYGTQRCSPQTALQSLTAGDGEESQRASVLQFWHSQNPVEAKQGFHNLYVTCLLPLTLLLMKKGISGDSFAPCN